MNQNILKQNVVSHAGFTLVELLVVITILAIISITAYTSFSWSTDKAKNSTKIGHIASIETGLNTFFVEKNYYPMPSQYSATNLWGYSWAVSANLCNTFSGTKDGEKIAGILTGSIMGWGNVYSSGNVVIGAKGTIDSDALPKQYLSHELSDPSINDIKIGDTQTFKDYGLGKYVYGVYAKLNTTWDNTSKKGSAYNVAMVIWDDTKAWSVTKISGNFDKSTCIGCPSTLIGSGGTTDSSLKDGAVYTGSLADSGSVNMAYPISGF